MFLHLNYHTDIQGGFCNSFKACERLDKEGGNLSVIKNEKKIRNNKQCTLFCVFVEFQYIFIAFDLKKSFFE